MKTTTSHKTTIAIYFIGIVGSFLIMIGLIWIMYYYTRPPGIDQARAAERRKNLAELTAQTKDQLDNYAVLNPVNGTLRVPIARAMELTVQELQNPAAYHSNLVARWEKSTKVPPPPNYE